MSRLSAFFLVILLSVTISACKGKSTDNLIEQNANALQNTANLSEVKTSDEAASMQNNSAESIDSNEPIEEKEVFYGEWIVKGQVASGRVSEYGDEEINKLLGKKLQYSSKMASYNDYILKTPYYEKNIVNEKDFFAGNYVSFRQLGIKNKSIVRVEVYTNKECNNPWDSIGRMFFVKDNNTLILYSGGIYFELVRAK